jgi:hypothetical protein
MKLEKQIKSEINNENKVKFFALYWGQEILSNGIEIGANVGDCEEEMFLLLKPLSSITDEDAEVIDLTSEDYNEDGWVDKDGLFYFWAFQDVDYLRSKGYALPWMGLSVEEMCEAGWIRLTEQ